MSAMASNHRRLDCLLNRLFRRRTKKTSDFRVTGLCEGKEEGVGVGVGWGWGVGVGWGWGVATPTVTANQSLRILRMNSLPRMNVTVRGAPFARRKSACVLKPPKSRSWASSAWSGHLTSPTPPCPPTYWSHQRPDPELVKEHYIRDQKNIITNWNFQDWLQLCL